MKYYKLTDENHETRNHTKWGENIVHKATGTGTELCSGDVIHFYDHPLKAAFFNSIHSNFKNPILWEGTATDIRANDGTKGGCKMFTTERIIPLPEITTNQRVRAAIQCAKKVCKDRKWNEWADKWLSGKDRSRAAAEAAYDASTAVYATARAAANAAAYAAYAADNAAYAAVYAAEYTKLNLVDIIQQAIIEEYELIIEVFKEAQRNLSHAEDEYRIDNNSLSLSYFQDLEGDIKELKDLIRGEK